MSKQTSNKQKSGVAESYVAAHAHFPTTLETFTEFFKQQTLHQNQGNKYHAVMLFYSEADIIGNTNFDTWVNTRNVYFTDGVQALDYYANTPCPASQLVSAKTIKSLLQEMNKMIKNFQNPKWLQKLYQYI